MGAILAIVGVIATALLGASNPYGTTTATAPNNQQIGQESCMPRLNKNKLLKVNVDPAVEHIYKSNNSAGGNKEEKTWVLVKENAPITAWKADLFRRTGLGRNNSFSEMEKIGQAVKLDNDVSNPDIGKDVYIGTGWCDPINGGGTDACLDPLVQDVIFVATRKGMTYDELQQYNEHVQCDGISREHFTACMEWGEGKMGNPPKTKQNLDLYYWTFNVYYDASKLPANATFNDLPCWMKLQCPNGGDIMGQHRVTAKDLADCEATTGDVLAASDPPDRPRLIIDKNEIQVIGSLNGITLADHYLSLSKLAQRPVANAETFLIGTAYQSRSTGQPYFNVWVRRGTVIGTATHLLILDPIAHPEGPWWSFAPILDTSKPLANTLQLGTFTPGIPSFFYEWWTPSCKPALYFYPEKETEISVKVEPNGYITQSIPKHGEKGWQVIAKPDGTINVGSATYPYLYYEAAVKNVAVPKDSGWIVETTNLPIFFNYMLPRLGLNKKESTDFLEYWIPKLNAEGHNWYITLIEREELDRVEPIEIFPKPDNFIRIRFYFEKIDDNEIRQFDNLDFEYLNLFRVSDFGFRISKPRRGFVVVDWGGIIANGSCGEEEVSR